MKIYILLIAFVCFVSPCCSDLFNDFDFDTYFNDKDHTYEQFIEERFGGSHEHDKEEYREERTKRSPKTKKSTYDDTYSDFLKTHFEPYDEYIPDKEEYQEIKDKKKKNESEEENFSIVYQEDDESSSKSDEKSGKLSDYDKIKFESDKQLKDQNPENCKKTYKDNLSCTVCKDPITGDNSEACSYASKPNDKKLAFSKQKSFSFKTPKTTKLVEGNEDYEEDTGDDEEEKPVKKPPPKKSPIKRNNDKKSKSHSKPTKPKPNKKSKSNVKSQSIRPQPKNEGDDADYGAYKLASHYDIDSDEQPKSAKLQVADKSTDTISNEKLNTDFEFIEPYNFDGMELNRALSDFKKKDWSKCSKKSKGDLTCYYCKDSKGFDQEECIFVSNDNRKRPIKNIPKKAKKIEKSPTVVKIGTIVVPEKKTLTILPVLSTVRPIQKQNYQVLPTTATSIRPEYTTRLYTDNPYHKKKAIKRMITIQKQYYDDSQNPTPIYPNIMYYKQHVKAH